MLWQIEVYFILREAVEKPLMAALERVTDKFACLAKPQRALPQLDERQCSLCPFPSFLPLSLPHYRCMSSATRLGKPQGSWH